MPCCYGRRFKMTTQQDLNVDNILDSILDSDDENYSTQSEEDIPDFSEGISDFYDSDCEEVDSNNESGEEVENNNE